MIIIERREKSGKSKGGWIAVAPFFFFFFFPFHIVVVREVVAKGLKRGICRLVIA